MNDKKTRIALIVFAGLILIAAKQIKNLELTGNADGGGFRFTNLADPTSAQDAATRAYVLANIGGGSGDLTAVQVSGGLLSVTSGIGPIPVVGLTTSAVVAAAEAVDTALDNRAAAATVDMGGQNVTNINDLAFDGGLGGNNIKRGDTTIFRIPSSGPILNFDFTIAANRGITLSTTNRITDVADPVDPQDAATRAWVLANLSAGTTNSASINADFATPTNYTPVNVNVDGHLFGIDTKLGTVASDISGINSSLVGAVFGAPFGADNRLIKTDGTNGQAQVTGISISDGDAINGVASIDVAGATVTDDLSVTGEIDFQNGNFIGSVNFSLQNVTNAARYGVTDQISGFPISILPPTLSAGYNLTLPTTDGTASQVLTTDGSGVLSWTTLSAGGGAFTDLGTIAQATNNMVRINSTALAANAIQFAVSNNTTGASFTVDREGDVAIGGVGTGLKSITFLSTYPRISGSRVGADNSINLYATSDKYSIFGSTEIAINEASQDLDFRVESNNDTAAIFVDGGTDVVGIKTATPSVNAALTINAVLKLTPTTTPGTPESGMIFYHSTSNKVFYYNGSAWIGL